jgi:hypothetical protein
VPLLVAALGALVGLRPRAASRADAVVEGAS